MQLDEDRWIETLAADPRPDRRISVESEIREAYAGLSRKAVWIVEHLRRRGVSFPPISEEEHVRAWVDFVDNACGAVRGSGNSVHISREPTVYVSYHHSSYPLLARSILDAGIHVLVARHVPWLQKIGGRRINFMEAPGDVLRACQRGESTFAMMDYCYEQTRSARYVPFLSYPARTPTGILNLARRYSLGITILTRDGKVEDNLEGRRVRQMTTWTLAVWMNRKIEEQVKKNPSLWLLWASLDRRLRGVDYDT